MRHPRLVLACPCRFDAIVNDVKSSFVVFVGASCLAALIGCAMGDDEDTVVRSGGKGGSQDGGGGSGADAGAHAGSAGASGDGGLEAGGASGKAGSDGGAAAAGSGGASAGGSGGAGGTAGKGGSAGTSGTGGTGGGMSCAAPTSCSGSTSLGTMAGDSGGATVQHSAATSMWLKLRVTEDDSSPIGTTMHLSLTLTVPSTMNFDLYAYLNEDSDVLECTKLYDFSLKPAGQQETLSLSWGETGTFANNSDDSRWVTIEVRYSGGTCSSSAKWNLTAKGN
jgi:hypothetical protein